MQKFEFLRQPLLGELAMSRKKKKKEKKMPFVVATYVYASSQGQRTHSARTNSIFTAFSTLFLPSLLSFISIYLRVGEWAQSHKK